MSIKIEVPKLLQDIAIAVQEHCGGRVRIVGGYVRDAVRQRYGKDIDCEVFGVPDLSQLATLLRPFGQVETVGASFAVIKLRQGDYHFDFALPRQDRNTGAGHRDFQVSIHSNLDYETAASRRDFRMNSLAYDIHNDEILDPFDGLTDIQNQCIQAIGPAYSEDPLRVLRAMRFAAQLGFTIHPDTLEASRNVDTSALSSERVFEELKKILFSDTPSLGFRYLHDLGLESLFPELADLKGVPQDPEWHPEGDAWVHTLQALDAMATLKTGEYNDDLVYLLAVLCHDFGKVPCTQKIDGRWRAYGHEEASGPLCQRFLDRLTSSSSLKSRVLSLVTHHMRPVFLYSDHKKQRVSNSAIRRLATEVSIEDLCIVARADYLGKGDKQLPSEAVDWLLERADDLDVKAAGPEPILKGRDLIALGHSPGKAMGSLLDRAYEAQLDDAFSTLEDAKKWLTNQTS